MIEVPPRREKLSLSTMRRKKQAAANMPAGERVKANPVDGATIAQEAETWARNIILNFSKEFPEGYRLAARRWASQAHRRRDVKARFYRGEKRDDVIGALIESYTMPTRRK